MRTSEFWLNARNTHWYRTGPLFLSARNRILGKLLLLLLALYNTTTRSRLKVLQGFGKWEAFQSPDQDGKKGIELLPHLPAYTPASSQCVRVGLLGFMADRKTWIERQPNSLCTPSSSALLLNLLPRCFCGLSLILSFYFPAVRPSGCCFAVVVVILLVSTGSNYSIDVIVRPAFGIYCCTDWISFRSWSFSRNSFALLLVCSFLGHNFRPFD